MSSAPGKIQRSRNIDRANYWLALLFFASAAGQAQEARIAAGEDRQHAISYERLMDYMRESGRDSISDAMAIKLIERFGLAFRPTAEELRRLRGATGARPLMTAIESARIPALPPVILDGALSIICAPVDCAVWVNDRRVGRTQGGVLPWVVLPPGKISVAVDSPNYDPLRSRSEVLLAAGERRQIEFAFQPSQSYLNDAGALLLKQMLDALGAPEPENALVRAAGTLYLRDEAGEIVPWSMVAWIRGGQLLRVQASRLNERVELLRTDGASWKETSGSAIAPQLSATLALLESALLPNQVRTMNAGDTGAIACDVDLPGARFRTEGPAGGSIVTLDSFSRPGQIEREVQPAGRARFLYSGYSELPGMMWPAVVEVVFADSRRGIEARFSSVQRVKALPEDTVRSSR
jgi:hypothetical protein